MLHVTLENLVEFTLNERKMVEEVLPKAFEEMDMSPRENCLKVILDYSKALSIRKSEKIIFIKMVLN